jgi:ribosomal protein S11
MREGYLGKKRKAYTSIFSVASVINKLISNFYINKYCTLFVIYKGWNRFRSAIRAAFNKKKFFNLRIKYTKYVVKIPHNGCRAPKQRNRSRMQKYFVKRKY